jgi:hypothetical protein
LHDNVAQCVSIRDLWDGSPLCKVRSSVIICALWNIWKRRNSLVFRAVLEPIDLVFRRCAEDLMLWVHRCNKQVHIDLIHGWAVKFAHLASPS